MSHGRLQDLGPFTGSNPQGPLRLLMHLCQERGVTGVAADRIERWTYADTCHVEAVSAERPLERIERVVEIANSKIVDADLVLRARSGTGGEESGSTRANRAAIRAARLEDDLPTPKQNLIITC